MSFPFCRFILFSFLLLAGNMVFSQDSLPAGNKPLVDSPPPGKPKLLPARPPAAPPVVSPRTDSLPADSLAVPDSLSRSLDSIAIAEPSIVPADTIDYRKAYAKIISENAYIGHGEVIRMPVIHRHQEDKDSYFYLICGLLFILGIMRLAFPKYFQDLFLFIFRNTSFRQKQLREQMVQSALPSFFLNFYFVLTGGVFISLLLQHYQRAPVSNFWLLTGISVAALTALYIMKFILLKLMGWMLGISEAMNTYIFIVFVWNKLLGLLVLPLIVLLAFANPGIQDVVIVLSCILTGLTFLLRYATAWSSIARDLRVSRFHFFLYLCAFEIAPLLLIFRALSLYF